MGNKKKKPQPPKQPVLTPEQRAFIEKADSAAAEVSGRTPSRVLKTFFPASLDIAGVKISPCGLGILGVLEAIRHPFLETALSGVEKDLTVKDIQTALYVFAHPREAKGALAAGKLDETVEDWVFAAEIPADAAMKAPFILIGMLRGSMEMLPGYDPVSAKEGAQDGPLESPVSSASPSETPA